MDRTVDVDETRTAARPEEICTLFRDAMARGDVSAALALYDREAVFVNEKGEVTSDLSQNLAASAGRRFDFVVRLVAEAGDIALMHTDWEVSPPHRSVHAIEVARRQSDGSWRWLIGDPFTVGRTHRLQEPSS